MKGVLLDNDASYRLGTIEILAQGGDSYGQFKNAMVIEMTDEQFSDLLERYFKSVSEVGLPKQGRLIPIRTN